ncbi:hypothetical protein LCGC14_0310650 [marine sediment metagenome]|uniref:Uncharacterized protein n=1 Tax=marine sediment metagenome TaxID=412755 RepID=A0A0F9U4M8_9ZZZZ
MPIQIKVDASPEYDFVTKVGSLTLEYGVRGRELEQELGSNQELFVRCMELQGLTLAIAPKWITNEQGDFTAWYAIDWEGKRKRKERRVYDPETGTDIVELPTTRETSLEDSQGEVEYRIVGIFWGPKTSIEILKDRDAIIAEEKASRNPMVFGPLGPPIDKGRILYDSAKEKEGDIL